MTVAHDKALGPAHTHTHTTKGRLVTVEAVHQLCRCSRATRDDIDVALPVA